jgi:succinate dehydrogenase/fumarate reductase flavoprotein subunit
MRGEKKDAFGREMAEHEINVPPYYYATVSPGTILTPGGVAVNENCQVVDKDGEVIEGLYATGETTDGYRAFGYRGGDALAHAAVTGYVAGKAASGK